MSTLEPEAAQTLLPLLERVANLFLAGRTTAREAARGRPPALALRRIVLEPRHLTLELAVHALGGLVSGAPRIRLELLATSPERTECRWQWGEGGGIARLAGRGLSLFPQEKIDEWVREKLGEGVRVEGERVVFEHAALAARLRRQGDPDSR